MEGHQILVCIRSEIHNVLATMRRCGRWATEERFVREIPSELENPLIRSLKCLHDYLQPFHNVSEVDSVAFLQPFLEVVAFPNTNGEMTARALSSLNKFLLYGALTLESPRGREAINMAVASIVECKFEATNSYSDEVVLMQLLEVLANLLRCPAGPFISDANVWKMVETSYRLKAEPGTSQLLRNTAANSLTHLILTLFSRSAEIITVPAIAELEAKIAAFGGSAEEFFDQVVVAGFSSRARRESQDGAAFPDDVDDSDQRSISRGKKSIAPSSSTSTLLASAAPSATSSSSSAASSLPYPHVVYNPAAPAPAPRALSHNIAPEDPDEALHRILQPIRGSSSASAATLAGTATSSSSSSSSSSPSFSFSFSPQLSSSRASHASQMWRQTASYGLPVYVKVLNFLAALADPLEHADSSRVLALQLINIVLESGGESLAASNPAGLQLSSSPIIAVLQGDLCKHLLQNSQSPDLAVLSLTLRVIFNLFNAMKGHLKVQLEVFLTSVHLRIAASPTASFEHKELALESLLDFCREPALMLDLYTNYDCDFQCTNLFETLCKCLCRCSIPASVLAVDSRLERFAGTALDSGLGVGEDGDGDFNGHGQQQQQQQQQQQTGSSFSSMMGMSGSGSAQAQEGSAGITVLEVIALEGVLAVVDSIARRCVDNVGGGLREEAPLAAGGKMRARLRSGASSHSGTPSRSGTPVHSGVPAVAVAWGGATWESEGTELEPGQAGETGAEAEATAWLAGARERQANLLRARKKMKRRLLLAARQFNKKPSKNYWLEYAQDLGILPTPATPLDVAGFFLGTPGLDKVAVGEYISEDPQRKPFNNEVMRAYVRSFDFAGVRIDRALRRLLESFRLPGEAQKVDRLMEAFGNHLFEQNKIEEDINSKVQPSAQSEDKKKKKKKQWPGRRQLQRQRQRPVRRLC